MFSNSKAPAKVSNIKKLVNECEDCFEREYDTWCSARMAKMEAEDGSGEKGENGNASANQEIKKSQLPNGAGNQRSYRGEEALG